MAASEPADRRQAFQPYWPRVLAIGLLILVTAGLGVVNPILIRVVFDSALFAKGGPNLDAALDLGRRHVCGGRGYR